MKIFQYLTYLKRLVLHQRDLIFLRGSLNALDGKAAYALITPYMDRHRHRYGKQIQEKILLDQDYYCYY